MYNLESQQVAAECYHNHLEDAHAVLDDFNTNAHSESVNKLNMLWNQLHMASGAKYMYSGIHCDEYSSQWLGSKGKKIIDELIEDAQKAKMKNALKTLKELRKIMEEKNLIN